MSDRSVGAPSERGDADFLLLGPPRRRQGDGWAPMLPQRRDQLLAFLAYSGDWTLRHRVARLLWSEQDDAAALRNLRHLLHHLGQEEATPGLVVTRRALRLEARTDTAVFLGALAKGDWAGAAAAYRGPFLAGMEEPGDGAFGAWLEVEREHLRQRWRQAAHKAALEARRLGDPAAAAELLLPLQSDDPLDEPVLQTLVTALADSGERVRALELLERFEATLREELGLLPTPATLALAATVRRGPTVAAEAVAAGERAEASWHGGPGPDADALVGREREQATLLRWLLEEGCRLLSVVGPGGVGKSRLAAAVAAAAAPVIGRVCTVVLDGLRRPELLPASVGAALGILPAEREIDLDGIAASLATRPTLLLLDGVEQVPGVAEFAAALLQRSPEVRLLLTAHERLHLPGERVLPLAGLAYEHAGGQADRAEDGPDGTPLHALPAVALFLSLLQRHDPGFEPDHDDLRHAQAIARSVDGSPLALELAAPWIRTLGLGAIAQEIVRDLDFLREPERLGPARQRSLRATFEHAWAALGEPEREALRRLSVFDGGFPREAAAIVAGAGLPLLSSAVEASWLQRQGDRFRQHALLRQFSRQQLAADPQAEGELLRRHSEYHASLLQARFPSHGFPRPEALKLVDEEYANVVAAWVFAVRSGALGAVEPLAEALAWWCELRGRAAEGVALLAQALARQEGEPWLPPRLHAQLTARRAWLLHWLEHERADEEAEKALRLARSSRDSLAAVAAQRVLGLGAWRAGRHAEAEERLGAAVAWAQEVPNDVWTATLLDAHGLALAALGRFEASEAAQRRAFGLNSRLGHDYQAVQNLINLSAHARRRADLAGATAQAAEAARLARQSGFTQYLPHALTQLAACQFDQGDPATALRSALEARALAQAGGDTYVRVWSALQLGRVAAGQQPVLSASSLHDGLLAAAHGGDRKQLLQGLAVAAAVAGARGERQLAHRWSRLVLGDPAAPVASRLEVEKLLAQLGASADPTDDAAMGAVSTVAAVTDEALAAVGRWRIEG